MARCICCGCRKIFSSLEAFDRHRAGSHDNRSRVCLDVAGMTQKGLVLSKTGIWSCPGNEALKPFVARVRNGM